MLGAGYNCERVSLRLIEKGRRVVPQAIPELVRDREQFFARLDGVIEVR